MSASGDFRPHTPSLVEYKNILKSYYDPKSYIETTDRRDFGGKPSKWRWGRVLWWKIPEFSSVGGARSKNSIFTFLGYPSTILRIAYRKQFYPKPMVPTESRDFEGVPSC